MKKDWNKESRNDPPDAIWIDSLTDDVWIRQIDKWKYLGKEKSGLPIDKYKFFKIDHKKDIPAEIKMPIAKEK